MSQEAEAALLGLLVWNSGRSKERGMALMGQASVLTPEDFRDSRHRGAWRAMQRPQ